MNQQLAASPEVEEEQERVVTHPRIAYFTESMLPWVDGVSRTLGVLFDTLERGGYDFRVFSPIEPSTDYTWAPRAIKLNSVAFVPYNDYRVTMPPAKRLTAELDAFAPDLIHVCSPTPAGIWAQEYAHEHGVPVVGSFHTHFAAYFPYYGFGYLRGLVWRYLRWFYSRCEATYTPSASMIQELVEHGIGNARLWSRGIDTKTFSPDWRDPALRTQAGAEGDTPLLLMVSRLVKEKDLLDLVAMDRILQQRGFDYRFAFIGDGPLRKRLEKSLPRALFLGKKTGNDLSRWYASADVFVFPSTTEAFGNVVQEAMASGIPPVVVDRGGPAGLFEPGHSGMLARANNPADFADKVAVLLRDPAKRRQMGENARHSTLNRTWNEVNAALLRDYNRIVAAEEPVAVKGRPRLRTRKTMARSAIDR